MVILTRESFFFFLSNSFVASVPPSYAPLLAAMLPHSKFLLLTLGLVLSVLVSAHAVSTFEVFVYTPYYNAPNCTGTTSIIPFTKTVDGSMCTTQSLTRNDTSERYTCEDGKLMVSSFFGSNTCNSSGYAGTVTTTVGRCIMSYDGTTSGVEWCTREDAATKKIASVPSPVKAPTQPSDRVCSTSADGSCGSDMATVYFSFHSDCSDPFLSRPAGGAGALLLDTCYLANVSSALPLNPQFNIQTSCSADTFYITSSAGCGKSAFLLGSTATPLGVCIPLDTTHTVFSRVECPRISTPASYHPIHYDPLYGPSYGSGQGSPYGSGQGSPSDHSSSPSSEPNTASLRLLSPIMVSAALMLITFLL